MEPTPPLPVPSKLVSRRDLDFVLHEWLDVVALAQRPRYAEHSRETFDAALDLANRIAADAFLPHYRRADREEPRIEAGVVRIVPEVKAALDAFAAAGLMAAAHDFEAGGMQLPYVVTQACFAHFNAANVATAAYPFLTMANANLIAAFGSAGQRARYLPHLLSGRFFGTMCLSEPQAGSSLGDVRTRAIPAPDGSYRIVGNKMWISGGDHELAENIVHLVLARIVGAPAGVKGLSLFVVPKRRVGDDGVLGGLNDVALAGLNHKLGYRGTTNCALNFGEAGGAWGELVGEPNRGLEYMFMMMNEARIGVGLGAVMLGYRGYLTALDYARGRPQGRLVGARDPLSPPVPIVRHADVRRMLLAQKAYVEGGLALALMCARLVDDEKTASEASTREEARLLLEVLTPVAKSWPSQWCLLANDLAIQSSRRLRIHPRVRRRAALAGQSPQRDPRGHPRHPGARPSRAQDDARGRDRFRDDAHTHDGRCSACDPKPLGRPAYLGRGARRGERGSRGDDPYAPLRARHREATGECERISGARGPHRRRVGVARTGAGRGRRDERRRNARPGLLPGEAAGLRLFLRVGTPAHRCPTRAPAQPRRHLPRDARRMVLTARAVRTGAATPALPPRGPTRAWRAPRDRPA
jgi:alkylation response protein AidB-like acyl-CoA dehydrogenase